MSDSPKTPSPAQLQSGEISFRFEKDGEHRVIPVSGAWGGPTPSGDIAVDLYVEQYTNPTVVTHRVVKGVLSDEISRDVTPSVTRRVMVTLMLTPEVAEVLATWLHGKVAVSRGIHGQDLSRTASENTH